MKVLIIDDDQFIRTIYSASMKQESIEAIAAEDGETGIEKIKTEKPDLILMDMLMPGMSGDEMLGIIKADPEMKDIPIIVISALSQESDITRVKEMGITDYLPKDSFGVQDVIEKIKQYLTK